MHTLLEDAHIPLSHRAQVSISMEEVIHFPDLAWLRATALERKDLGARSASTAKNPGMLLRIRCKAGGLLHTLERSFPEFTVTVKPS